MSPMSLRLLIGVPAAAILGLALAVASAAPDKAPDNTPKGQPTVVELFQSQGCSSCPPANENILAIADRPDLLVLSFGVTYWDKLGWKDTFASRENTQRQYDYTNGGLHRQFVATPQVVINGHIDIVGTNKNELTRAVAGARLPATAPVLTLAGTKLSIAAAPAPSGGADVWLVRYDPRTVQVPIQAGENGGRTLPHRNVVHELVRLGGWDGKAANYTLPEPKNPAYRTAILLQGASGGRILASLKT